MLEKFTREFFKLVTRYRPNEAGQPAPCQSRLLVYHKVLPTSNAELIPVDLLRQLSDRLHYSVWHISEVGLYDVACITRYAGCESWESPLNIMSMELSSPMLIPIARMDDFDNLMDRTFANLEVGRSPYHSGGSGGGSGRSSSSQTRANSPARTRRGTLERDLETERNRSAAAALEVAALREKLRLAGEGGKPAPSPAPQP